VRTVWVSDDAIGRDCLDAAAGSGVEIVGIVTLPEEAGIDRSARCSFEEEAARLGAARLETRDVNSEDVLDWIRALAPELVFVVGWYQLVREPFIALASEGTFGMHPTLLPRHRGRASIPWAILSGLARTGVTLFEIVDATADSGAIVGQRIVDIATDETATTLFDKVSAAHVELVRDCVPQLVARAAPRLSQDPRRASSWPRRRPADGIIDWETRAPYLYDWVRAQTRPYPGAFTYVGDEKVVVWSARPIELGERAPAGTVVAQGPEGAVVACGEGALVLEEIETDGVLAVGVTLG
jgi:methionyl-tRNA formyltransferase